MANVLYVGNDNDVFIKNLRTASDETNFVNTATLRIDLYDQLNAAIITNLAMTFQTGSTGHYRATIDSDTYPLVAGTKYTLVIESTNFNIRFVTEVIAKDRTI